ncbi:MAG: hypothetical protein SFX18_04195 [Pirellulales bacterium]|nr:hypothetical protein [Pirellulales bacterium]
MPQKIAPLRGRVIKLGGSLLTLPDWPERLHTWLTRQTPLPAVLIVGGGDLADLLRAEHARHPDYSQELMHALAIACMDLHGQLALARLPGARLVEDLAAARHFLQGGLATENIGHAPGPFSLVRIPAMGRWLGVKPNFGSGEDLLLVERSARGNDQALPATWDVTSDSIAAWAARELAAEELVLLKSCLPDVDIATENVYPLIAESGYVDRYFPVLAKNLPSVRFVDLGEKERGELRVEVC